MCYRVKLNDYFEGMKKKEHKGQEPRRQTQQQKKSAKVELTEVW